MNIRSFIFSITAAWSSSTHACVEKVWPHNALWGGEKIFRETIESAFPDLDYACYHASTWRFAIFEDFDHDRILFICPPFGDDNATITRNDKRQRIADFTPATLKVAGALTDIQGNTVSHEATSTEQHIGYWITLESTDRFSLSLRTKPPAQDSFTATYDPDASWRSACVLLGVLPEVQRADVYGISRKPLIDQITLTLESKPQCHLRMDENSELYLKPSDKINELETEPLIISLIGKSIFTGTPPHRKKESPSELDRTMDLYFKASRATSTSATSHLIVGKNPDDSTFRNLIKTITKESISTIYFGSDPDLE